MTTAELKDSPHNKIMMPQFPFRRSTADALEKFLEWELEEYRGQDQYLRNKDQLFHTLYDTRTKTAREARICLIQSLIVYLHTDNPMDCECWENRDRIWSGQRVAREILAAYDKRKQSHE